MRGGVCAAEEGAVGVWDGFQKSWELRHMLNGEMCVILLRGGSVS